MAQTSLTLSNSDGVFTVTNIETLTGGTGADTVTLGASVTGALINLGSGTDNLTLANGTNSLTVSGVESTHRRRRRRHRHLGRSHHDGQSSTWPVAATAWCWPMEPMPSLRPMWNPSPVEQEPTHSP